MEVTNIRYEIVDWTEGEGQAQKHLIPRIALLVRPFVCPEQNFSRIVFKMNKGLFINDVINFGGYRNPPSPSSSFVTFWLPPLVRVTRDNTGPVTKQRMLSS